MDIQLVKVILLNSSSLLSCATDNGDLKKKLQQVLIADIANKSGLVNWEDPVDYNRPRAFLKKVIRKYVRWAMRPVICQQVEFNTAVHLYLMLIGELQNYE